MVIFNVLLSERLSIADERESRSVASGLNYIHFYLKNVEKHYLIFNNRHNLPNHKFDFTIR